MPNAKSDLSRKIFVASRLLDQIRMPISDLQLALYMTTHPGLFYAYAKNDRDDWSSRYLITFASRAVADEWWRTITLSIGRGYTRFSHVVRHSIQFYSFNSSIADICDTLTDGKVTSNNNLLSKVFFTLLDDRGGRMVCPAPVLNCTDHRSGDAFYVRSMLQPDLFWFYDSMSGVIRPSKSRRNKFTITVVDSAQGGLGPNPIMIGSDRFTIRVSEGDFYIVEGGIVGEGEYTRPLDKTTVPTAEFDFSDFDGGFEIRYPRHSGDDLQDAVIIPSVEKRGERWELV